MGYMCPKGLWREMNNFLRIHWLWFFLLLHIIPYDYIYDYQEFVHLEQWKN